ISSLLIPLPLEDKETHFNVGLHLMASLVLLVVMLQSKLYWFSSLALAILFAIFLWRIHRQRMHNKANEDSKYVPVPMTTAAKLSSLVKIILGFYSLYLGGEILVKNGSFLSLALGIPPYVLSVIMVAFGTSFPELATALLSIWRKKETGLIVGNIIGSNVFNVCFVLASLWPHNVKLPFPYLVETSILLFVSIVFVILCRVHRALNKVVGSIFLMIYLGLIFYWYQAPG
ncbi:MAG: sodium:calcium antiporter, partial [Bacteriovoracia bacterium]